MRKVLVVLCAVLGAITLVISAEACTNDSPSDLATLLAELKSEDSEVRSSAAHALGMLKDKEAVPALTETLKADEVRGVRSNAAWALGEIKDPTGVTALIAALKDKDEYVQRSARWALETIGRPAVENLVIALEDKNLQTRLHAAEALRMIGDKRRYL